MKRMKSNYKCRCQTEVETYTPPIHEHILLHEPEQLKELLKEDPSETETHYKGRTPLITAVKSDSYKCLKILLKYKAHIDGQNIHNETALVIATKLENLRFIKILVENGASIYHEDRHGRPVTNIAIDNDNTDIIKILHYHKQHLTNPWSNKDYATLAYAIHNRARRCIDFILGLRPPITNYITRRQHCPIAAAISKYDETTFFQLAQLPHFGALVNIPAYGTTTYLHMAVERKQPKIVKLLLEKGAVVNLKNEEKRTPLQLARDTPTARMLLKAGARIETHTSALSRRKTKNTSNNEVFQYLRLYKNQQEDIHQGNPQSMEDYTFSTCECPRPLSPLTPSTDVDIIDKGRM